MRRRVDAIGELRLARLLLGAAICVSATWLMIAGGGLSFVNDDIFYYAQFLVHGTGDIRTSHGLEYFLAPSNGHLQVLGKLIYRAIFEVFGANYAVFRAFDVAGVMACVVLFFELARRRVGPLPATPGSRSSGPSTCTRSTRWRWAWVRSSPCSAATAVATFSPASC